MPAKSAFLAFSILFFGNFSTIFSQSMESEWASERKKVAYKTYWTSLQWLPGNYSDLQNDLKTRIVVEIKKQHDSLIICRQFVTLEGKETAQLPSFQLEKRGDFVFLIYFTTPETPIEFRLSKKEETTFTFEPTQLAAFPKQIIISREAKDAFKMMLNTAEVTDQRARANFFKQNDATIETIKSTTVKQ